MVETRDTGAAKLLALLEALAESDTENREGLTIAELARAVRRDTSIVSRQVKPLVELGVLERGESGRHTLGWRLFTVAARAGDQRLLLLAPPVMRKLTQLVDERVHLNLRRGTEVFTILAESPHRNIEAAGWVGRTTPAACTSAGYALLWDHDDAEIRTLFDGSIPSGGGPKGPRTIETLLDRVADTRRRGHAVAVDEFDDDLSGVASPVRDFNGRIIAALNISAPTYRFRDRLTTAGQHLQRAAAHLSHALSPPPVPATHRPRTPSS